MSQDKDEGRIGYLTLRSLICWLISNLSTGSRQFHRDIRRYMCIVPGGLANRRYRIQDIHGEVNRFIGPMRQADGQQPADELQTFFVDATMQADADS